MDKFAFGLARELGHKPWSATLPTTPCRRRFCRQLLFYRENFDQYRTRTVIKSHYNGSEGPIEDVKQNGAEWGLFAIPSYLYSSAQCGPFDTWLREAAALTPDGKPMNVEQYREMMQRNPVWLAIRSEAERDAKEEPILSSFLWASILSHDSFERSLAFVLANRLADTTMMPTELFDVFYSVLRSSPETVSASLRDCQAFMERDPACLGYSSALLYFKGFHALQGQRISHLLWNSGRKVLALALQSRISEVLSVDIHPATRLGHGILLDHGTGIVIGETAVIGNDCSLLQGVTLGGTGKASGDRHPKVGNGVLIGANATVLGNIQIGDGAQIAAGSLVLKPVPNRGMVAGSPAKLIGLVAGQSVPALEMQHWVKELDQDPYDKTPSMELEEEQRLRRIAEAAAPTAIERTWGSDVDGVRIVPGEAAALRDGGDAAKGMRREHVELSKESLLNGTHAKEAAVAEGVKSAGGHEARREVKDPAGSPGAPPPAGTGSGSAVSSAARREGLEPGPSTVGGEEPFLEYHL